MRVDPLFAEGISRLRTLIIRDRARRLFLSALLLSLIFNALLLGMEEAGLLHIEGRSIHVLLCLVSIALCAYGSVRSSKGIMGELIEIDARLGLKERLSTAYECHHLGRRSIFAELLIKEAGTLLGLIRGNRIFPGLLTPFHLLIPLFAVLIVFLLLVDLLPSPSGPKIDAPKRLERIGSRMEEYARQKKNYGEEGEKGKREDLYRQMQKVARELQTEEHISEDKLLESLDTLIGQVKKERMGVSRRLMKELSIGDSHPSMDGMLEKEDITLEELMGFRDRLGDIFDHEIPGSVMKEIKALEQELQLERFLGEAIDEVRMLLKGNTGMKFGKGAGARMGIRAKDREQDKQNLPNMDADLIAPLMTGPVTGKARSGSLESPKKSGGEKGDRIARSGKGKGTADRMGSHGLESPKTPVVKDKGEAGPGDWYNVHIRSLPGASKAEMKKGDIIRSFKKELEGVLQKEDIPLEHKEYIKNYFLSIGLRREENSD